MGLLWSFHACVAGTISTATGRRTGYSPSRDCARPPKPFLATTTAICCLLLRGSSLYFVSSVSTSAHRRLNPSHAPSHRDLYRVHLTRLHGFHGNRLSHNHCAMLIHGKCIECDPLTTGNKPPEISHKKCQCAWSGEGRCTLRRRTWPRKVLCRESQGGEHHCYCIQLDVGTPEVESFIFLNSVSASSNPYLRPTSDPQRR
jgi:hypothetical protein